MPYFITQFRKPKIHRAGHVNRDLKHIGPAYPNFEEAKKVLCELMDKNRVPDVYLRIDHNVSHNAVAYADLDKNGGVIRFRQRDKFHFSDQITLAEFKERLAKKGE